MAQAESTMFSLTVAAGGEPSSSASSPGDMEDFNEDMKKSSSRFQVARVDSKTDRRDSGDNSISGSGDAGESRKYSVPDSPGVAFSISTDSVTQSYETTTRNYMLNTIEALPCVDNYRNIFSATGQGMKSRPTLAELHEEMVSCTCRIVVCYSVRSYSVTLLVISTTK